MITREEIDDILEGNSNEVLEACAEIAALQRREKASIKTGIPDLDHFLITGLNNMIVAVGSRPSMGKTHLASVIKKNLLKEEINPNIDLSVLLLNWEMQTKSLVLRHMKQELNRSMRDILSREFTDEEKEEVQEVMQPLFDDRILNFNHVIEGEAFEYLVEAYIDKNEGKEVVIIIDHIHILLTKTQIDEFLFLCNRLKKKHTNLSFVIFFQLNREIEKRWRGSADVKVNPKSFVPNSGDIYNTDSLQQFADIIVAQVIPQVVDLDEYTTINKDRNKHLEDHYIPGESDNKTAKLKGRNRVYRHYLKIRLNDNFEDPRIYCDVIDPTIETGITEHYLDVSKNTTTRKKPTFPARENEKDNKTPIVDITVSSDLSKSSAVGQGFEDDDKLPNKGNKKKTDKPF